METMSYLRDGIGKSHNAIIAEQSGLATGTAWSKILGDGASATDIETAIPWGEWHHTGKYGRRTRYYDNSEIQEAMPAILAARDARKAAAQGETRRFLATVECTEFYAGKYGRKTSCQHEFKAYVTQKPGRALVLVEPLEDEADAIRAFGESFSKSVNGNHFSFRAVAAGIEATGGRS